MKTKTLITIVTSVIFTSSIIGFSQQEKPDLSNTMEASCVVRIIVSENILPADNFANNIFFILSSSNIGGKIAKQILGVTPESSLDWESILRIKQISKTYYSPPNCVYTILVSVNTHFSGKPAAEEFLFALVDAFRKSLENASADYMQLMDSQSKIAQENAKNAEIELRTLQEDLRIIAGPRNLSREAVLNNISAITEELRKEKSKLSIMAVRRENLAKQIAEIRQKVEEKIKDNLILSEMNKILAIESQKMEYINAQVKNGQLPEEKLLEAQVNLTKAKIELAQKEQEIKDAAGGRQAAQLMEELNNFNFIERENAGKTQNLEEQLAETERLIKSVDEWEIVSLKVNIAKISLEKALERANEIKRGFINIAPSVKVVGPE